MATTPSPLLTDKYQLSMAYAYWKARTHAVHSSFDLYFRRPPFGAAHAVFAGLSQCLRFLSSFRFTKSHVDYISSLLPQCDPHFLRWLQALDCSALRVHAQREGSIVFANVPLMRVSGPLAVVQLLETTLLNLVNYASLVATNAFRFRIAAGPHAQLFEFGLRRAQGPDGAMSASRYTVQASFDATSNVAAGFEFRIPVVGTHAHSFVQSFSSLRDCDSLQPACICTPSGQQLSFHAFKSRVLVLRDSVLCNYKTSDGELAAFITYAFVYPASFLALVDTYHSLQSGVPNFLCVAFALHEYGFEPLGIRLDSGHLAHLSIKAHSLFCEIAQLYARRVAPRAEHVMHMVSKLRIVASDNITVAKLLAFRQLNHKISAFGIGTQLVTCAEQPAFGGVFKLCSVAHNPRMKLSDDPSKTSTPGEKAAYRVYNEHGKAVCDVLALETEQPPPLKKELLLRHRDQPEQLVTIVPYQIRNLHHLVWNGQPCEQPLTEADALQRAKTQLKEEAQQFDAHVLGVICETKPYPVLLTPSLYQLICRMKES
eukprot:TRINITY_DN1077_c0_g3_i1.p1 TRINITY_DN1077_c0_g3~~TRINITY_DN1077_c0_g3_i1.p1  ORF type:complete len:541 (-),score=91.45 TRINITY_DN1077_c0_g3_i1:2806-4428(-)